jgi:hypothetical protein
MRHILRVRIPELHFFLKSLKPALFLQAGDPLSFSLSQIAQKKQKTDSRTITFKPEY